jgi:hypothetical protein
LDIETGWDAQPKAPAAVKNAAKKSAAPRKTLFGMRV